MTYVALQSIIGSLAILWTAYGIHRRKKWWIIEGLILLALVLWNTLRVR